MLHYVFSLNYIEKKKQLKQNVIPVIVIILLALRFQYLLIG